jgi:predicted DCC family thiol-disulfide oxidoreductase YuxK
VSLRNVHDLVTFDGVCNLCAYLVRLILSCKADSDLHFVPLQSPPGVRLLRQFGFDPEDVRTFVLVSNGLVFVKSDAALEIARHFRWPWKGLKAIRIVPRLIRNWFYDRIAQNRNRWFGRNKVCMVPTPELRTRFIED